MDSALTTPFDMAASRGCTQGIAATEFEQIVRSHQHRDPSPSPERAFLAREQLSVVISIKVQCRPLGRRAPARAPPLQGENKK